MMVPLDGRVFLSPLNEFTWEKIQVSHLISVLQLCFGFFSFLFFFWNFIDPLNSTVWELLLDALLLGSGLNLCQKKQCNACTRPFIGHWWREASGLGSLWLRNAAFPEFGQGTWASELSPTRGNFLDHDSDLGGWSGHKSLGMGRGEHLFRHSAWG